MKQPAMKKDCDICGKIYKKVSSLQQHMNANHHGIRVNCPDCPKTYVSTSILNRHRRNKHGLSKSSEDSKPEQDAIVPNNHHSAFENHAIFRSISKALTIETNLTFGTHMVAKEDIAAGQMVAAATPFACIEYLEATAEGCFVCGKKTKHKVQCTNCIDIWFCNHLCKTNKLHRKKCDAMFDSTDCEIVRLASKIILNAIDIVGDMSALFEFSRAVRTEPHLPLYKTQNTAKCCS